MIPPRGPRRLLCVVVVTKCACGTGLGCCPPATNPLMCAMSANNSAPTLSAISRIRAKSSVRGYADAPTVIIFGFSASACFANAS